MASLLWKLTVKGDGWQAFWQVGFASVLEGGGAGEEVERDHRRPAAAHIDGTPAPQPTICVATQSVSDPSVTMRAVVRFRRLHSRRNI